MTLALAPTGNHVPGGGWNTIACRGARKILLTEKRMDATLFRGKVMHPPLWIASAGV